MSSTITFIFAVLVLKAAVDAVAHHSHDKHDKPEKHEKTDKRQTCQEFTQGVSFNDSQAIGAWHLLHYSKQRASGLETLCVQFSPIDNQERKDLQEKIEKYVENLKWERLIMKMQILCPTSSNNLARHYYLEKLEGDGSYRTLQMPPPTAKLDLANFHRYPLRLKMIEGDYLGMMDCHEKFVFILGKQPSEGTEIDERLKKMIEIYWPQETD